MVEIDVQDFSLKGMQQMLENFFLERRVSPTKIKIPKNQANEKEFLEYCKSMNIQVVYND